jgi:DNA repair exonuclease SbcCD ATPase subunit
MSILPGALGSPNARITILEERLQSFDQISKQMLEKLEQAVDKISESNQNISLILTRHEERLDRSAEANSSTLRLIERTEAELKEKISGIEKSLEELKKTRWMFAGIVLAATLFLPHFDLAEKLFETEKPMPQVEYFIRRAW